MEKKICSFFGHKEFLGDDKALVEKRLNGIMERLVLGNGITHFYFVGFGDFDDLCLERVKRLQKRYPYVKGIYCLEDEKHINDWIGEGKYERERYQKWACLPLEKEFLEGRTYFRNCAMIDESSLVVFYLRKRENSETFKAYRYAKKKGKDIVEL